MKALLSRRTFLAAAALAAQPGLAQRKPNIVFILLDDLGYADLGCYGQKQIQTPHIDSLARDGLRFTDAYAGAAVCAPSRSVLMTGLHGGHAPVRANAGTIPMFPEDVTIPEVLKAAGYKSGMFGKWGLGDARSPSTPLKQGFDEAFGYYHQTHAHTYFPDYLWKNDEKFPVKKGQYSADLIADQTLDFIRRHKGSPFFVYAAWTLPHGKYEIPSTEPYSNREWPETERTYAAMVTRADAHVGKVLGLLKEFSLDRDTVVIFASDNGGTGGGVHKVGFFHSNGPLRDRKGSVYEGGIRVPLIVRWPGKIKSGSMSSLPCGFVDMLPTMAGIAGVKPPKGIDGVSVLPEIVGEPLKLDRTMYWEHVTYDAKSGKLREAAMLQAARRGSIKAVKRGANSPVEIYDLAKDIGETKDLAPHKPELAKEFEAFLRSAHASPRPHNTGTMGRWAE